MNKKILQKIRSAGGLYVYDYSEKEDVEALFEEFGGEECLKHEFPQIYEAFQQTQKVYEMQKQQRRIGELPEQEKKVDIYIDEFKCTDDSNLTKLTIKASAYLAALEFTAQDAADGKTPVPWLGANLSVVVCDKNEASVIYYSNCFHYSQPHECYFACETGLMTQKEAQDSSLVFQMHAVDSNKNLHSYAKERTMNTGISLIKKFTVHDPYSKKSNRNVLMLYGRHRNQNPDAYIDADYYNDNDAGEYYKNSPKNDTIKTLMPISGEIQFAEGCTFPETGVLRKPDKTSGDYKKMLMSTIMIGDVKIAEMYDKMDDAKKYEILSKCFTTDTKGTYPTVTFNIENEGSVDWQSDVSNISAFTNNMVVYHLKAAFELEIKDAYGISASPIFSISSIDADKMPDGALYYHSNSGLAYVPPVEVHWGCFALGTMIQLSDGSTKKIEEIMPGDRLTGYDGSVLRCMDLISGMETEIFSVSTKEHTVKLTGNHPVLCSGGDIKNASQLQGGDLIETAEGESLVTSVTVEPYDNMVINIVLENNGEKGAYILANGIFCGDFYAQNRSRPQTKVVLTKEQEELIEELKELSERLGR